MILSSGIVVTPVFKADEHISLVIPVVTLTLLHLKASSPNYFVEIRQPVCVVLLRQTPCAIEGRQSFTDSNDFTRSAQTQLDSREFTSPVSVRIVIAVFPQ